MKNEKNRSQLSLYLRGELDEYIMRSPVFVTAINVITGYQVRLNEVLLRMVVGWD